MADVAERVETGLYETDEHTWIESRVAALRSGNLAGLDRKNLAGFLSDVAGRDRRELASRLTVLLQHVLKCVSEGKSTRNWQLTVMEQQREIRRLLKEVPSLKPRAETILADIHQDAVEAAAMETGIEPDVLRQPRITLDEVLNFTSRVTGDD